MNTTLSILNLATLFWAMVVLAALPSVSALAVAARSAVLGFRHGIYTILGIVLGDAVFILIAVVGLAALGERLGPVFLVLKYVGGAYLIFLGLLVWRSRPTNPTSSGMTSGQSWWASFATGLLITLGDQKAVVFYLAFLPAFVDVHALRALDTVLLLVCAVLALVTAKLPYAWLGNRANHVLTVRANQFITRTAALVLALVGILVLARP